MNTLRQPLFREATTALLVALLLLQSASAVAPGPAWWDTPNVIDRSAITDDFAVANVGQLKHLATKAAAAMDAELPGGAGEIITALVASWNLAPAESVTRDNYLAVNQGQLKHVATPFYDRLGLPYPWAGSSAERDNYLLANLGQLKHVFSFELKFRTLGQGPVTIPEGTRLAALAAWNALGDDKPVGSTEDDFDGDGIPNLQEYLMGNALFDPDDLDGDRIADDVEDAHPGILSKLDFADAVRDQDANGTVPYYDAVFDVHHYGDGVMNYEELLLELSLSSVTTTTRTDSLTDAEVLAWTLNAGTPLASSTDALRLFWEGIDLVWITDNSLGSYLAWLDHGDANNDGVPDGLATFRTDVLDPVWPVWQPGNPGVWNIESPPLTSEDMDGDGAIDSDRDNDGLPDLWEYRYSLNLRLDDTDEDPDGDGLTNTHEYAHGTNPLLADSDGDGFDDKLEVDEGSDPLQATVVPTGSPALTIVGSGYEYIYPGQTTPALAVKVTQAGLPVIGATVIFNLTSGDGQLLSATALGLTGTQLSVVTGSNGMAAVTYEGGDQPGSATVSASAVGMTGSPQFTVNIVGAPGGYGSNENSGDSGGSNGGIGANSTKVPPPPRSTANSAADIAAATGDGFRILVRQRDRPNIRYPYDLVPEFLWPGGKNPVALVGWQAGWEVASWCTHTRLEFQKLPLAGPFEKPVIPSGVRRYLVLVYQGVDVDTGIPESLKHVGVVAFQYSETGARVITLSGEIPVKFIKRVSDEAVVLEPPLATKPAERVWIRLVPVQLLQIPTLAGGVVLGGYHNGTDWVTAPPAPTSMPRFTRWRAAYASDGQLIPSWVDTDADRVSVRIGGPVVDPEYPWVNVVVNGITGVDGRIDDSGLLDFTERYDSWLSEPFVFVTDVIDDKYSGPKNDDDEFSPSNQTRLASFGAEISLKIKLRGQSEKTVIPMGHMQRPPHSVKVELNILKDFRAVTKADKDHAKAAFDATRLLYRQIGVELMLQGDEVNEVDLPVGFTNLIRQTNNIDHGSDDPQGPTFAEYLNAISAKAEVLKVYFTMADLQDVDGRMGEPSDPLGWGERTGYHCIVEMAHPARDVGYLMAHEIGHVLGAGHPTSQIRHRVMNDTYSGSSGDYYDPRRFSETEEGSFLNNKFYK